ncbi:MAG: glycine cleavage system aminomethyltransferase GcvT [Bacteroidia bacterium]
MNKTALYDKHIALGAKMVPFAGFDMPVSYTGIVDEHLNVRQNIGVFDVSHMGEFEVSGPRALELLQYITSNDVAQLFPGRVQYSCMPNENGGIVDDLLVYMMAENSYLLVVNASNMEKDFAWISKHNEKFGCELKDISDQISLMAVQGPKTAEALRTLTEVELTDIPYYHFRVGKFADVENVIISATGYTGSGGFEIYCKNEDAPKIWDAIFEAGFDFGIKPAGLGCRDTLRLEMGFCLYGNDINDETSPLEAGLGWITKFNKDFVAKDIIEAQKKEGVKKKLVGLELFEKVIPRQHFEIYNSDEKLIGEITSGTMAPSLNKPIAMGYVETAFAKEGTPLKVKIRNKMADAKVVKLPFYKG